VSGQDPFLEAERPGTNRTRRTGNLFSPVAFGLWTFVDQHILSMMQATSTGACRRKRRELLGIFRARGTRLEQRAATARSDRDAQRTHAAQTGEEFIGVGDVSGDLGAQFFRTTELFFLTQTIPEMYLDPAW
jgi:hypothetical protein